MDFSLHARTVVDAPAADVFDLITDIDRLPEWNAEIPRVVERPAALVPEAQWVVEIHAMHTRWNSRSQVVDVDRVRGIFRYRSRSDDGNPSYADWTWEVTEGPEGTTVHVSVEGRPRTFLRKHFFSHVRPRGLQKAMEQSLRALRTRVQNPTEPERA